MNRHEISENQSYVKCAHDPYPEGVTRKWLKVGSSAYEALSKVINGIVRDLPYMTKFSHNGGNEVYHSVRNKYAPKRLHFSYEGMIMRSQLAILDVNLNVNRPTAKTKSGKDRFKLSFTKMTGEWVAKPIKVDKDKSIFNDVMDRCEQVQTLREILPPLIIPNLPKNIANREKPDKEQAILSHQSRFSK